MKLLIFKGLGFVLIFSFLYGSFGCATHPERKTNLAPNDLKKNGVITGSITKQRIIGILGDFNSYAGHKIVFKNIETGKVYPYLGADYFQLILPEGKYALSAIRLASGSLAPKPDPLTFSVTAGNIKYIGSVVGERDAGEGKVFGEKKYVLKTKRQEYVQRRNRTIQRATPKEITLYVVDARTVVEKIFRNRNPELSGSVIITEPMR